MQIYNKNTEQFISKLQTGQSFGAVMFMADLFYANHNSNVWNATQCYATQM